MLMRSSSLCQQAHKCWDYIITHGSGHFHITIKAPKPQKVQVEKSGTISESLLLHIEAGYLKQLLRELVGFAISIWYKGSRKALVQVFLRITKEYKRL